jgi:hypothetical protein
MCSEVTKTVATPRHARSRPFAFALHGMALAHTTPTLRTWVCTPRPDFRISLCGRGL